MDRETALTALEEASGVRLGDILTTAELEALPESSDPNRAVVDRVLLELTGHGFDETHELDKVLKTYKAHDDGSAQQTSSFATIGPFIDGLAGGIGFELTPLYRQLVDVVLLPVFHDGPAADWCVFSPTAFAVTDPVLRPEAARLDAEYRLICERLARDYERLEKDPAAVIKTGTTSVGRYLQIRTKDAKPYHPMQSPRLGIPVSDKTYGFYLTTGFLDHLRAQRTAGRLATQPVAARREVLRRLDLLTALGTSDPTAQRNRELDVYVQGRGIYRNLDQTRAVCPPYGVTQTIQIRGDHYEDEIDELGLTCRYPVSRQPVQDARDVAATKNAERLGIPLFVILPSEVDERHRNVRLATVVGHDDNEGYFALLFGASPLAVAPEGEAIVAVPHGDFALEAKPDNRESRVLQRVRQSAFRAACLEYYGSATCAFCDLSAPETLDAAHLRDKTIGENGLCGSDHPQNGLILCATHHRALARGLVGIEPVTLLLQCSPPYDAGTLHLTRSDLGHLAQKPHADAVAHAWHVYLKRRASRSGSTSEEAAEG